MPHIFHYFCIYIYIFPLPTILAQMTNLFGSQLHFGSHLVSQKSQTWIVLLYDLFLFIWCIWWILWMPLRLGNVRNYQIYFKFLTQSTFFMQPFWLATILAHGYITHYGDKSSTYTLPQNLGEGLKWTHLP
jgi:hypothetical protein